MFIQMCVCVGVGGVGIDVCEYMQTCPKWQSPWVFFLYILSAFLIVKKKKWINGSANE